MTATTRFIEDAIKGEYNGTSLVRKGCWTGINTWRHNLGSMNDELHFMAMLLDTLAWQAVGKTRGWTEDLPSGKPSTIGWQHEWHRFIDALADGKDIEEALQAIE